MSQVIAAIPTKYKGRQYRSRLEARWAAMFDLLKWRVEYEPCDFKGWIPDFVIQEYQTVFVEVKPLGIGASVPMEICNEINASGCEGEVLVLGYSITGVDDSYLGWLGEFWEDGGERIFGEAAYGRWEGRETKTKLKDPRLPNIIGFCSASGAYYDRITGAYDGGSHGSYLVPEMQDLWAEAGNIVQWAKPVGAR